MPLGWISPHQTVHSLNLSIPATIPSLHPSHPTREDILTDPTEGDPPKTPNGTRCCMQESCNNVICPSIAILSWLMWILLNNSTRSTCNMDTSYLATPCTIDFVNNNDKPLYASTVWFLYLTTICFENTEAGKKQARGLGKARLSQGWRECFK